MKVLLVNPPFRSQQGRFSRGSRSPAISRSGTIYYPFWLAYAAGILEREGFPVKLVDAPAERYSLKDTLSRCADFDPELIVVDTSTPSIYSDVEFVDSFKAGNDRAFVTLVGTHPSALPQETLGLSNKIDAVALGEYDYTIRDLAKALQGRRDLKQVKGLFFRKGKEIIKNEFRVPIEDLDSLPFVSSVYKHHLNYRKYFFSAAQYPMVMIITGRGCPHRCFFCVYPSVMHGRKYRFRSPENVVSEFEYITENFRDVKEIGIEDDTFTVDKQRVNQICAALIEKNINKKIDWWVNTRVDLSLDTMHLMKKAGCRLLIAGFESGAQGILDNMHKGIGIEQSREFAYNAKKAGLLVHGCFIFGAPGETKATIEQTILFAKQLPIDSAQFFPLIAYPGTAAYDFVLKNNYLEGGNFSDWLDKRGQHACLIHTAELSSREILNFCGLARKQFYLRASYVIKKLWQSLLRPSEAQRNSKVFLRLWRFLGGKERGQ